jgi:hypothetical protein
MIDAYCRPQQTPLPDGTPIHHPGCVARDENKYLSRIRESHRLQGELRHEAAPVNMVYKNAEKSQATKKIEPQVAF